jgi:hypothetical protein
MPGRTERTGDDAYASAQRFSLKSGRRATAGTSRVIVSPWT